MVEHEISFDDKSCLIDGTGQYSCMNLIRCRKHELYSEEVNKLVLSPHDDKREVLQDGVALRCGKKKVR